MFHYIATSPPCAQFVCDLTNKNPIGKCLNLTRVCDGYPDCIDKTDEPEDLCNYTTTMLTTSKSTFKITKPPQSSNFEIINNSHFLTLFFLL